MIDFFALFGLEARPVIDTAVLSDLFASKSKTAHPDRAAGGDFATLNEAFRTLSDPASRIWHLLALSGDERKLNSASAEVSSWFGPVAAGLQRFDKILQPLSQETSTLLRAMRFGKVNPCWQIWTNYPKSLSAKKKDYCRRWHRSTRPGPMLARQIEIRWHRSRPICDLFRNGLPRSPKDGFG
jgi:curved DNA-binding protein CbpA